VQDRNLFNIYKEKKNKGYFSFEKAIIYKTDLDIKNIHYSINIENIKKQVLLPDSKKNDELLEAYSALYYFNHFVIDTIKGYCAKLVEEKEGRKRELLIAEYKSFKKSLCLTKEAIPFKLCRQNVDTCFEDNNGNIIDMIQESSILDAIVGEYSIPEILIFYKEWELTYEQRILEKILEKINLYIQKYFYLYQDTNSNYLVVKQLTSNLNHNSVYKDIETLFIKFHQILQLAMHHFRLGTESKSWGYDFFFGKSFDVEVPNISMSFYMIEALKEAFPEKNEFDILSLQHAYSTIARGKDLYNILFNIIIKLDELPDDKKQVLGKIDERYSSLILLFDYNKNLYDTFVYNNAKFYSNDIEQLSVLKSSWEKKTLVEKKEDEKRIREAIVNNDFNFFELCLNNNDDIDKLMLAKQEYLRFLRRFTNTIPENKIENFINTIVEKMKSSIEEEEDYSKIYQALEQNFSKYERVLKQYPSLLNSLASAEYLYSIYIINSKEKQDFDYSCISIMYYMSLENFLNKLIYIPYKKKILELNKEDVISSNKFLSKPEKYMYKKKYGLEFKKTCELGNLAFLCSDVEITIEFNNFLRQEYYLTNDDIEQLRVLGEGIKNCTKNRNDAAHGSEIILYERVVEDKKCVYPIASLEDTKGLLMSLMEILFDNKK
jgi:hypothetical protein